VPVADEAAASETLNLALSFAATSKLVPLMFTVVLTVPIAGVNPLTVGAPVEVVTVNDVLLVAVPLGAATHADEPRRGCAGNRHGELRRGSSCNRRRRAIEINRVLARSGAERRAACRYRRADGTSLGHKADYGSLTRWIVGDREQIPDSIVAIGRGVAL